jgi:hypothetical protein
MFSMLMERQAPLKRALAAASVRSPEYFFARRMIPRQAG